MRQVRSFCRICSAGCGTVVTVDDDNHFVEVRGDKEQPQSRGYACAKGINAWERHQGPSRLLRPLRRTASGDFEEIGYTQALNEIAGRLQEILGKHGPDALGMYVGGGAAFNSGWMGMQSAFLQAVGSSQLYTTLTIDQSAKLVSFERMGGWGGGTHDFHNVDVVLILGINPAVSHGMPVIAVDPIRRIKRAKAAGTKVIVIDPRRTETGHFADLMLQPLPGQDVAIMAGIIRVVLENGWQDHAFCGRHIGAERMAQLRAAVEPFDEAMVERRAKLEPGQIRAVAEMFARNARRGAAFAGTGPCMAPFGNTTQHLVDCLTFICGRVKQAGDRALTDMIGPNYPLHAQVIPPMRSYASVPPSRIRGAGLLGGEKLTSTLAEEILTPGKGQIHAMMIVGANPILGIPNHRLITEAFRSLDLLVAIEPFMNETARLSHYILPPVMMYERADLPLSLAGYPLYPDNWTQYTPAVLEAPPGSDVMEETLMFWELGKRMGLKIIFDGKQELTFDRPPTRDELLEIRLAGSRFTLDRLKSYRSGLVADTPDLVIQPALPGADAKLDPMPPDVAEEIAQFLRDGAGAEAARDPAYPFILSSRRMRELFCSTGREFSDVQKRLPYNPAYLAAEEMLKLGLQNGDRIRVTSDFGSILAYAETDPALRPGVVSLSHGWGGLPEDETDGACVNALIDSRNNIETINAMPRMSAIPVSIVPAISHGPSFEDDEQLQKPADASSLQARGSVVRSDEVVA